MINGRARCKVIAMERLTIDLETLPEEGKQFTGELDKALFDIDDDEVKSTGNLKYDLFIRRYDKELLLQGEISAAFEFRCVRCLEHFDKVISLPQYAESVEIDDQSVIDVTDLLREEIILEFPAYPHCEDSGTKEACKLSKTHFGVDKEGTPGVDSPAPNGNSGVWDALDALGDQ